MLDREHKVDLRNVEEGDTVTMGLNAHDYESSGSCLTGEIIDLPSDGDLDILYEGDYRPMTDVAVEGKETGTVWRWNVDNGYVIGPVDAEDRPPRSDIGKVGGIYSPAARDDFDKAHDAGIHENPGEQHLEKPA